MFSQLSAINNCLEKHILYKKLKHRKLMSDKTYRKGANYKQKVIKQNKCKKKGNKNKGD